MTLNSRWAFSDWLGRGGGYIYFIWHFTVILIVSLRWYHVTVDRWEEAMDLTSPLYGCPMVGLIRQLPEVCMVGDYPVFLSGEQLASICMCLWCNADKGNGQTISTNWPSVIHLAHFLFLTFNTETWNTKLNFLFIKWTFLTLPRSDYLNMGHHD